MTNGINVNRLQVFLGHQKKIGTISVPVGSESEISLAYDTCWIDEGFALSPHLPLSGEFDHRAVRNYLQNLLPEGRGLEEITSNTTISKNNTFGLIRVIGEDTSGALSFSDESRTAQETSFREISNSEMSERLTRFKEFGESIAYWDGRTRLSVAGVKDKLNLLEINDTFGFGGGELCSNKIFKFETGKAPYIVANELFTMLLAGETGIQIPNIEIRSFGDVRTLVVDRFDRRLAHDHKRVMRRHIIDGCQATNLPPSYKYERQHGDQGDGIYYRDGVSFPKLFAIKTSNTAAYQKQLIEWMTFNLIVRNYDAHGKNISFYVSKQGLLLTPFYDLVNVEAIIRQLKQTSGQRPAISANYAMSIGEHHAGSAGNFADPITAFMLADLANEVGLSGARLQLLMRRTINTVLNGIATARSKALEQGLSEQETSHIDLCIQIVKQAAKDLSFEVDQLLELQSLVK